MAESGELARPYAVAAFKQAEEEGRLGEWAEMLDLLVAVARDATMSGLIANPRVDRARLVELIIDVCDEFSAAATPDDPRHRLSDTGRNFVKVVGQYGRFALLPDISQRFAEERAAREGRNQVHVTSAFELSKSQRKTIVEAMETRLGTKVTLDCDVDDSLIGGVVIRAGDLVIDASLRGRLAQLAQTLA